MTDVNVAIALEHMAERAIRIAGRLKQDAA